MGRSFSKQNVGFFSGDDDVADEQVMVLELLISSNAPIGAYTFALETSLRFNTIKNMLVCTYTMWTQGLAYT